MKITDVKICFEAKDHKEATKIQYDFNLKTGKIHTYDLVHVGNGRYHVWVQTDISKIKNFKVNDGND